MHPVDIKRVRGVTTIGGLFRKRLMAINCSWPAVTGISQINAPLKDIGQDFVHPPGIGVKTDSACVCVCVPCHFLECPWAISLISLCKK